MPVNVGPVYEGERIRAKQMFVELGGPKIPKKFEFVRVREAKDIKDGEVFIKGPDLKDMEEGKQYPVGIFVEVAGEALEVDLEAVFERRVHEFLNYIEGVMHLNQRYDTWMRVSKAALKKGLNSFEQIGKIIIRLYKAELGIIEKAQVTFYTSPDTIEEPHAEAMKVYEERDARARGMKDEDVSEFYGCVLCQSFAPTHCCIITPNRTSLCGSINWFDARAAAKVDPNGPLFKVEKGECLNLDAGEYTGANETLAKRSLGEVDRLYLYSGLEFPHTSCGCFEAIAFFVPEVDGYGIVDRNFKGNAVNGLPFSAMANSTGGGKQMPGFNGIAIEYMRSPKFIQYDGGWTRVVWMPKSVKSRVEESIPGEILDKIATEEDAVDIPALQSFLKEKGHPIVNTWVGEEEEEEEEEEEVAGQVPMQMPQMQMPQMQMGQMPMAMGGMPFVGTISMPLPMGGGGGGTGFRVILKNCRIQAESVVIKKIETGGKKKK
ncbi:MAG: CO dehydrogenase/CO-methylating acetyl-CoA synthase complex subunit beta [Promethearchaeota archaeon]